MPDDWDDVVQRFLNFDGESGSTSTPSPSKPGSVSGVSMAACISRLGQFPSFLTRRRANSYPERVYRSVAPLFLIWR